VELLFQPGGHVYIAEAPLWQDSHPSQNGRDHLLVGISPLTLRLQAQRGLSTAIGQLFGVVIPGLILTKYLFRGLKRPMMVRDDATADNKKMAATWANPQDARFVGSKQDSQLECTAAPVGRVFVVYLSPNLMIEDFPDIYGWAEHWTWISADPTLDGAPIEWDRRYDHRLWTAP
jgi:hypothetical protein